MTNEFEDGLYRCYFWACADHLASRYRHAFRFGILFTRHRIVTPIRFASFDDVINTIKPL
jgi:hypothetical protein